MLTSVIFFLFIALSIITGLVSPAVREFKISSDLVKSRQSFFLSESAVEDSYYRLKTGLTIGSTNTITLGENSATATITDSGYNEKTISSLGDVDSRERTNELKLVTGDGTSFSYGMHIGTGGLDMQNSAVINGSVYANGNITGQNSARITGTVTAAGPSGVISGMDIGELGTGNAYAHTVNNSNIEGSLYCQSGTGNNKDCNTSQGDPALLDLPISDSQITGWQTEAQGGGTDNGDINLSGSETLTIGARKIVGSVSLSNFAVLTVSGTLWITGNLSLTNTTQIRLDSSYGTGSGVILVDGTVSTSNSATFSGSGSTGSYVMVLSTSTSSSAINIQNSAGTVILVAPYGTINFSNSAGAKEAIANRVTMQNTATLTYESGLQNVNFVNGPSGGWGISSWKEVE